MKHIFESTLLLVDDNRELREMVAGILQREGFMNIDMAACVKEAEDYLLRKQPDMIILDINLPDGDGFSLMQRIRTWSETWSGTWSGTISEVPVLFLSARDEDSDRLLGLGLGADDYMVKPFLPKELVLRISAILKRTYFSKTAELQRGDVIIELGKCNVGLGRGTVIWNSGRNEEIPLTAKEMAIMRKLWENRGNIVTFDQLCQAVWEDNYFGYENTIMVHIRRLREKIEENPSRPKWLLTVRGLGYKLVKQQ